MRSNRGKTLIFMGLLLIAAALCLASYNLYDTFRAGQSVQVVVSQMEECIPFEPPVQEPEEVSGEPVFVDTQALMPDYVRCPDMEMPVQTLNGLDYIGVLQIPSLELELPILSRWSYPNLKTAPCRYSGSVYRDDLILCAHNYASHFGGLKNLQEGDLAAFTDMNGNVFTYQMVEREILQPEDIVGIESGDWDMTLFTCTSGGKSRVTARFVREKD